MTDGQTDIIAISVSRVIMLTRDKNAFGKVIWNRPGATETFVSL